VKYYKRKNLKFKFLNNIKMNNTAEYRLINQLLKNLIKDIKDDNTGVKYVYLQPFADDSEMAALGDTDAPKTAPEKTVDAMAKSALANRS